MRTPEEWQDEYEEMCSIANDFTLEDFIKRIQRDALDTARYLCVKEWYAKFVYDEITSLMKSLDNESH